MKRIAKISAFLIFMLCAFVMFAMSAFAGDIAIKTVNISEGVKISWGKAEDVYRYEIYRKSNDGADEKLITVTRQNSYVDKEAVSGTIYGYRVVTIDSYEEVAEETDLSVIYRLDEVKISNYYSADQGLFLEWKAVAGAKGYYVLRKPQKGGKWQTIYNATAKTTSYLDTKISQKERYLYTVRAYGGKYIGAVGKQVALSAVACPEFIGIVSTENGISLKWTEAPKAAYYVLYRKDSAKNKKWTPYALFSSEYTSYEDTEIQDGVEYSYIVRASDASGRLSPYDAVVTMKHIGKPVILSAESETNGIKLTWSKSAGAQGYAVYRKDFGIDDWKSVGLVVGADNLTFTDSKVLNAKAYTYVVRAVWKKNLSTYDEKGATVRFMEAPQNLVINVDTARGNVLTWKANPLAKEFIVYRKSSNSGWRYIGRTDENVYADMKADASEIYSYAVKAYTSSVFLSGYSDVISTFVSNYDEDTKMIALTYDDGPSEAITNGILDLLEAYGAKATFFVIGESIEYNNTALTRAAKLGNEIGTHTYSHIDLPTSSEETIREEIDKTDELVKKYTGEKTKIARPPGGELDDESGKIVNKPFFYWTVDTRDWESKDANAIIEIVEAYASDGDIILMHDIYESTLEASEYIIPWLVSEGYELVTVSELMAHKSNKKVQPGVMYYDGFGATSYEELE